MSNDATMVSKRNKTREKLGDVLPLKMPFGVSMYVSNVCNFECSYCLQAIKKDVVNDIKFKFMELDTFKACIDNMYKGGRIKSLLVVGMGEPLLNPNIIEMVTYAKHKNIADSVEIITNASILTHEMSDQLIEAGLDKIRISLQGLSSEAYEEISNVKIDFEKFQEQIAYFYKMKSHTQVYIKIMDIMLKGEGEEDRFREIFSPICDEIGIESLIRLREGMDYTHLKVDLKEGFYGQEMNEYRICSTPFYSCVIDWDGTVFPCCMTPIPIKFGNAVDGFCEVWRGKEYNGFLLDLLSGGMEKIPVCRDCTRYSAVLLPNDAIDNYAEELISKYTEMLEK